jgi:hypothetical protein
MRLRNPVLTLLAITALSLTGCDYSVPLTAEPTGKIDERLLGQWISPEAWMKVSRFDDRYYVIYYNGQVFRAWHSSVADLPLFTVQAIDSKDRKYAYLTATFADSGDRLNLRVVRDDVIAKTITDSAAMQKAMVQHRNDPGLLTDEVPFSRMK